jgi:enamine deaminase RidA (YjgF/YER057c/UK114 family)
MSESAAQPIERLQASAAGPRLQYVTAEALHAAGAATVDWRRVLALVSFGALSGSVPAEAVPMAEVDAAVLGGGPSVELWQASESLSAALSAGRLGRVHYRCSAQLLFATLAVHEREFAAQAPLGAATFAAYRELFNALETLGYPHALRVWNYLPQIHGECAGAERYWHFNIARREAFLQARRSIAGQVPAASVLGVRAGGALTLYCLAAREPPQPIDNPRQCSPWSYPPQYGPQPPTFARACLLGREPHTLFISGTASILGHRSVHPGDTAAQTRETLRNIEALVDAANRRLGHPRHHLQALSYKVYVRHAHEQPLIAQLLRTELGPSTPILYLQADVCRRELLVEMEALGS